MIFRNINLAAALVALPLAPALAQTQTAPTTAEQPSTATEATTAESTAAESTAAGTQGAPAASADAIVLATAADVKTGLVVNDQNGQNVGKIESVEADGAVLATDKVKAKVPLSSFGKKGDTLVVGISKADFEAAVAKSTPAATK